jgi:hypothetical protein
MIHHISIAVHNHTAISVPLSMAQIRTIADREQWRMVLCRRGENYFDILNSGWKTNC